MTARIATRSFALDDIRRSKTGDGRTVEAYAAVFDTPVEIVDQDGHYNEQIGRSAFNRTIAHRGTRFGVFYNHGRTLYGTASESASIPLGSPVEVRTDSRGLLTVTRYNKTRQADDILEAIDNGDIGGQSFTGRMRSSTPARGPYRSRGGELTLVTRNEIELIEYGPTPFPAYEDAAIVGRRSMLLSDADETLLRLILQNLADADAALDPIVDALCKTDDALDVSMQVIAQMLGTINPDSDADDPVDGDSPRSTDDLADTAFTARLQALSDRLTTHRSGTPDPGRASAGSLDTEHPAPTLSRTQLRARLHRMGLKP